MACTVAPVSGKSLSWIASLLPVLEAAEESRIRTEQAWVLILPCFLRTGFG